MSASGMLTCLLVIGALLTASLAAWNLDGYQQCGKRSLPEVGSQLSGAAYSDATNTWWLLLGHPQSSIAEYSAWPEFKQLRRLGVAARDIEGLTWREGGLLAISDESNGAIITVDVNKPAVNGMVSTVQTQWLQGLTFQWNKGIEGVAFDRSTGKLILAQEERPRRVHELDPQSGAWKTLFDLENYEVDNKVKKSDEGYDRVEAAKKLKDLADVYVSADGRIFLLSQESRRVAQVDRTGSLLQSMSVDLPRPEGLAFSSDGRYMLVASEGAQASDASSIAMYAVSGQC